jgi:hypothetical protein
MLVVRFWPKLRMDLAVLRISMLVLMLGLIVAGAAGTCLLVSQSTVNTISRDEWRFVDILQHWYGGTFSLDDIWSTNAASSEHRTPAFKLYFLGNALWFGLDTRIGCFIGVAALVVFVLLMYRYFIRVSPAARISGFDHLAFLPVALVMFSLVQIHIYNYDLLSEFAITGSMLFAAVWIQMDLKLRVPQPTRRYGVYALSLCLLLLSFGAGKGPALIVATLVLSGSLALQADRHRALRILAWSTLGILVAEMVYWYGGAGDVSGGGLLELAGGVLHDLPGAFHYLLHALGAAFATADLLPAGQSDAILNFRGGLLLAAAFATLAIYLYLRMYRRHLVTLTLALFAAAYMGELVVGRFGDGTTNGAAPRYVFTTHLLVVALVFVLADTTRVIFASGRHLIGAIVLVALTTGIGWVEYRNLQVERLQIHPEIVAQHKAIDVVKARLAGQDVPYPAWYCPGRDACDDAALTLKEHRLSMFHDDAAKAPGTAPR